MSLIVGYTTVKLQWFLMGKIPELPMFSDIFLLDYKYHMTKALFENFIFSPKLFKTVLKSLSALINTVNVTNIDFPVGLSQFGNQLEDYHTNMKVYISNNETCMV